MSRIFEGYDLEGIILGQENDDALRRRGLMPDSEIVPPVFARGAVAGTGEALRRGGETLLHESHAGFSEMPEAVRQATPPSLEERAEMSVLEKLKGMGGNVLGMARVIGAPFRSLGAPVTAAWRTATELPLTIYEKPGETRDPTVEAIRQGVEIGGSIGTGIVGGSILAKLRNAASARQAMQRGLDLSETERSARTLRDLERIDELKGLGRELGPGPRAPLALPGPSTPTVKVPPRVTKTPTGEPLPASEIPDAQLLRPAAGTYERVFEAGPPGSVTGKPKLKTEPLPVAGGYSPSAERLVKPGERIGAVPRVEVAGQVRDRSAITEPLFTTAEKPPSMSLRDWVKLQRPGEREKVNDALKMTAAERAETAMPAHVEAAVNAQTGGSAARNPRWIEEWAETIHGKTADAKALSRILSPSQVARGNEPMTKVVNLTYDAEDEIGARANDWIIKLKNIFDDVDATTFKAGARARDMGVAAETPQAQRVSDRLGEVFDEMADSVGLERGHPKFLESYFPRARQKIQLVRTELRQVGEYTPEDVRRFFPSETHPGFLRKRVVDLPADDYSLSALTGHARNVARASVMGTENRVGYLTQIKPHLDEISRQSPAQQEWVAKYVNHFIGAPKTSVSELGDKASRIARSLEFMRTIGGNVMSPVYNKLQTIPIFAETSVPSFVKALRDEARYYRGADDVVNLVKKAKIDIESVGPHKLDIDAASAIDSALERGINKVRDLSAIPFGVTEKSNRLEAFFGGYHDAVAKGADEAAAIAAGRALVQKTQFPVGKAGKPELFRGPLGAVAGQFKTFTIKMGEYIYNNAADMAKRGATPAERLDAARKFVKFWGASSAIGGSSVLPILGAQLEKHDMDWKGAAPYFKMALTEQLGVGALDFTAAKSLRFYLPPAASHIVDAAIATGATGADVEDRARAATRSFPVAGVQLERLRSGASVTPEGKEFEPTSMREAFGLAAPTGELKRQNVDRVGRMIGVRTPEQEQESKTFDKLSTARDVYSRAVSEAARLRSHGDPAGARRVLIEMEKELGIPIGSTKLSEASIKAEQKRRTSTSLERMRQSMPKALRKLEP